MKKIIFASFLALVGLMASCSKGELPYDLEGTEHGVVINIKKAMNSSLTLSTDLSGDYKMELSIPKQQGDICMLKEAQLMAVYTPSDGGAKKSVYVVEGITEFPYTATVDLKDVCQKLGISGINVGDRLDFTPCTTLTSGTQVDGWQRFEMNDGTVKEEFNNKAFTGWVMEDGSSFSYRQSYKAFAPFVKDKFKGTAKAVYGEDTWTVSVTQIAEMPDSKWIPAGVSESDLVGLLIEGTVWYNDDDKVKIWINTTDFTLVVPDQTINESFTFQTYGTYPGNIEKCQGEVDTQKNTISLYLVSRWGPYSLGDGTTLFEFE